MSRILPILLFLIFFIPSILISHSIGPSWDEPDNIFAGGVYFRFFKERFNQSVLTIRNEQAASIFGETIYTQNTDLERYPPFPLLIGGGIVYLKDFITGDASSAQEIISIFHIISAMFLGIAVVGVYGILRLFKCSSVVSAGSGLLFGLHPLIVGHGLSTIKDSAQVSLFIVSLYFLLRYSMSLKRKWLVIGAISWGLGLATKFNVIYVPIIWGLFEILSGKYRIVHRVSWESRKNFFSHIAQGTKHLVFSSLVLVSIGLLTMIVVWPYLWFDPITRFVEVIQYFTTVGQGYEVVWNGQKFMVGTGVALWWYPLGSFLLSTPLPVLFFTLFGLVGLLRLSIVHQHRLKYLSLLIMSVIWFVVPLIRIISPMSAYYDGFRHFMEVLPIISILSGVGVWWFCEVIGSFSSKLFEKKNVFVLLVYGIVIVHSLSINVFYFPYSSGFINSLGSNKNISYDREYSGLAIYEGMKYLLDHYDSFAVWVPIGGHLSWYYIRPGIDTYVYTAIDANSIVFVNKVSHATRADLEALLSPDYRMVHEIKRGHELFGWVYRRE